MKQYLLVLTVILFFISGCADKTAKAQTKFIKNYVIKYKSSNAINIIKESLKNKNYTLVSVFDHEKEALKLKKMLYPAKTITIYNSKISTKLIQCNPSMALEMPIRVAIYSQLNGTMHLSYTDPEYWSLKHNIKNSECLNLIMLIKRDLSDMAEKLQK